MHLPSGFFIRACTGRLRPGAVYLGEFVRRPRDSLEKGMAVPAMPVADLGRNGAQNTKPRFDHEKIPHFDVWSFVRSVIFDESLPAPRGSALQLLRSHPT